MREFAHDLYNATKKEASETEIKAMIKSQMSPQSTLHQVPPKMTVFQIEN